MPIKDYWRHIRRNVPESTKAFMVLNSCLLQALQGKASEDIYKVIEQISTWMAEHSLHNRVSEAVVWSLKGMELDHHRGGVTTMTERSYLKFDPKAYDAVVRGVDAAKSVVVKQPLSPLAGAWFYIFNAPESTEWAIRHTDKFRPVNRDTEELTDILSEVKNIATDPDEEKATGWHTGNVFRYLEQVGKHDPYLYHHVLDYLPNSIDTVESLPDEQVFALWCHAQQRIGDFERVGEYGKSLHYASLATKIGGHLADQPTRYTAGLGSDEWYGNAVKLLAHAVEQRSIAASWPAAAPNPEHAWPQLAKHASAKQLKLLTQQWCERPTLYLRPTPLLQAGARPTPQDWLAIGKNGDSAFGLGISMLKLGIAIPPEGLAVCAARAMSAQTFNREPNLEFFSNYVAHGGDPEIRIQQQDTTCAFADAVPKEMGELMRKLHMARGQLRAQITSEHETELTGGIDLV